MVRPGPAARPCAPRPSLRSGHSLPELIVAVTFLGTTLLGVTTASLIGARWAEDGIARQEAAWAASALLDSLAAGGVTGTGAVRNPRWTIRWTARSGRLVVTARSATGEPWLRLEGAVLPRLPVLPDSVGQGGPP